MSACNDEMDSGLVGDESLSIVTAELLTLDLAQITSEDERKSLAISTLQKMLSVTSVLSAEAAIAIKQEQLDHGPLHSFNVIGDGFCAEIFEKVGSGVVYKKEIGSAGRGVERPLKLWNDYKCHRVVGEGMGSAGFEFEAITDDNIPLVRVPRSYRWINNDPSCAPWWQENGEQFSKVAPSRDNPLIHEMERIPALPKVVRQAIITAYGPKDLGDEGRKTLLDAPRNQNCLIRLYLGRRPPLGQRDVRDFKLENFPADLNIVDELGLEKEFFAREMGRALAVMHWRCKLDAEDVEFVLGSAPASGLELSAKDAVALPFNTATDAVIGLKRRVAHMWLLDFNNCKMISFDEIGVKQATEAYWRNDPYYPRPVPADSADRRIWDVFASAYTTQSDRSLAQQSSDEIKKLPGKFLAALEAEAPQHVNAGPPRGMLQMMGRPPASATASFKSESRKKKVTRRAYIDVLE